LRDEDDLSGRAPSLLDRELGRGSDSRRLGSDPERISDNIRPAANSRPCGPYGRGVPRPPRIQVADGLYHITSKGNTGRLAFRDDVDRTLFLRFLSKVVRLYDWSCRSYCVLSTHYHLLCLTPQPNIAAGMQYLNGRYAQWANWRREERGHIFEGRYGAALVETEGHLLEAHRYIAMNPVRAGIVRRPEDWPWSSYPALIGRRTPRSLLDVRAALADFGPSVASARRHLRTFIRDAVELDKA
jgi:putative transposase